MTEVLDGIDSAAGERAAALRAQGRFFWLDTSLGETRLDDLAEALAMPDAAVRAPRASRGTARTFHADGESVVFGLRCNVEAAARTEHRLRPLDVRVVVTADYVLTLHDERLSLPAALDADLPDGRSIRYVVYSVLEALIASSFDALEEVEVRLDTMAVTSTGGTGERLSRATLREVAGRLGPCAAGGRPSRRSSSDSKWRSARCAASTPPGSLRSTVSTARSTGCWPRSTPPRTGSGCCYFSRGRPGRPREPLGRVRPRPVC